MSQPLRILQVVDTLDAGGMEAQLVALMNRLDPEKFVFHVICLRHAGVHAGRLREDIKVTALNKAEGFQWEVVRGLGRILAQGWDLVHTHNWAPLVYGVLATRGGKIAPLLHGEHAQLTNAEKHPLKIAARRLLYRCCAAVHTVSAGQRDELRACRLAHPRLLALINGVDTQRFHPADRRKAREHLGLPRDAVIAGLVARYGAFKRHAALVEAFEQLADQHPQLRLVFVGDGGPEKESVQRQVAASPYSSRILLAGHQSNPVPWYQSMNFLVVPSINEGLSNATLEAMACGVPVLSNDICGSRELLGENEAGKVCDLSEIEKVAAELAAFLSMPSEAREALGKAGRARAETRFSWQGMAAAYSQAFMDCARDRR